MNNYIISCSTTCDLDREYLESNKNSVIHFYYYIDDEKYVDSFYSNIGIKDFFDKVKLSNVKTSQPSPDDYIEVWEEFLKNDIDVLHIELSSGISGAYNSALIAKDLMEEKYKNAKVLVIDSLSASTGYGMLVKIANKLKNENKNIDENFNDLMEMRHNVNHIFFTSDLSQFLKGGRISKTSYAIGKLINIIPILHVTKDGKLEAVEKARGMNNVKNAVLDMMKTNIINGFDYEGEICISNSDCENLAKDMLDTILDKYKKVNCSEKQIYDIGTVIGSHTGRGTVAIFYIGDKRV